MSKIEIVCDYLDDELHLYVGTVTRNGEKLEDITEYWPVLMDWLVGHRERALLSSRLAESFGRDAAAELLEVLAPRFKELLL